MRIGYCTRLDPFNKRSWSGIHYYAMKALEKHCGEVVPLIYKGNDLILLGKILKKLMTSLLDKNLDYIHTAFFAKHLARGLKKLIEKNTCDLLFFMAGSELLAYLETDLPVIYYSDTTFKAMVDFYATFSRLLNANKKWGNEIEQRSIDKASAVIFSSEWSARSAVIDYGCNKDKVYTVLFGANMDGVPSKEDIISQRQKTSSTLRLLFVGVDWVRKRGELSFQTMLELNKRGIDTELVICGCNPPIGIRHEKLLKIGFLDKNYFADAQKLHNFYMNASIFLLPTKSECSAIAYCEASAYGLPIITTNVGGVSTYVENGFNGEALSSDSTFTDYADAIQKIWEDKNRYLALCKNSRAKFENELNWDSWGRKVREIIYKIKGQQGNLLDTIKSM